MNTVPLVKKYSIEEYVQLEQETNTKYEYHDGKLFAMAGDTLNHSSISTRMTSELDRHLEESNCIVFNNDAKLNIVKFNKYVYPDAMIVCGVVERSNQYPEAITNPIIIIQVLSESTAAYDRGDKFKFYRSIPSLQ